MTKLSPHEVELPAVMFARITAGMEGGKYAFLRPGLDDTTLVMMATSLIDEFLRFLFIVRFRDGAKSQTLMAKVFEGNGPLSTFSSKVTLCSALGLLTPEYKHDLSILRKVRNDFAHSPALLTLKSYPACLSLKVSEGPPVIDAACKERERFVRSAAGIVFGLGVGAALALAENEIVEKYRDEVKSRAAEMLDEIFARG